MQSHYQWGVRVTISKINRTLFTEWRFSPHEPNELHSRYDATTIVALGDNDISNIGNGCMFCIH